MRKLSQITESVWSDIQDRSVGQSSRREDIIKDIFNYLNSHYLTINAREEMEFRQGEYIYIMIYECLPLNAYASIEIDNECLKFSTLNPSKYRSSQLKRLIAPVKDELLQLYNKIKKNYDIKDIKEFDGVDHWYTFTISHEITKEFCEEFIDFILDNIDDNHHWIAKTLKKKNMNESVWSDIQDRSTGELKRKEDDVNLLDRDEFYKYIMHNYETYSQDVTGPYSIINSKDSNYILIPILEDGINTIYRVGIWNFDKPNAYITIPIKEPFYGSELYVKIRDKFRLESIHNVINPLSKVLPKGCINVNNKFYLEVIDFIIDNTKEPYEPLLKRI